MKFCVQAYTIQVGDILAATGEQVTSVTSGPGLFNATITAGDKTYIVPKSQIVGIQE